MLQIPDYVSESEVKEEKIKAKKAYQQLYNDIKESKEKITPLREKIQIEGRQNFGTEGGERTISKIEKRIEEIEDSINRIITLFNDMQNEPKISYSEIANQNGGYVFGNNK